MEGLGSSGQDSSLIIVQLRAMILRSDKVGREAVARLTEEFSPWLQWDPRTMPTLQG